MATLPMLGYTRIKSFQKNKNKPNWPRVKKIKKSDEVKILQEKYSTIDPSKIKLFTDFPLSANTLKGLKDTGFHTPTDIQRDSIGYALQGEDILGAAQTGSGKTLAFLIPVLETLNCKQWTRLDGIGALIITPTRELAYQIFETLKKVGKYHDFSAGLIIGGKDLHFEKSRMDQCNIVICTPGRILHHMDVNPLLDCSKMQILVLDEADRCLDLGFQQTMNSIIENLPPKRQTLLFSATQTKSVKDLGRLSLKNPKYVAVHESKKHSTPDSLEQSYMICELHDKLKFLWSFIKNHRRQKILIFLSSCKQVKFMYQLFCRLRPGSPLLALYGTLHQLRRMKIYNEFCGKQNVVMFATDIAARGLDFPEVDWVLQLDCPEDANTYIHRAGRTARYCKGGESLLVLLPSEVNMLQELEEKRIPINKIEVNPTKLMSPLRKIEALLARDPNLKADAQRAFVAYMKSVFLMKNKQVFQIDKIDMPKFAESLGLIVTPRVRFLKNQSKNKEEPSEVVNEQSEDVNMTNSENEEDIKLTCFVSDDEDDILTVKRQAHDLNEIPQPEEIPTNSKKKKKVVTKIAIAKKLLKKKIKVNKKVVFNEEGEAVAVAGKEKFTDVARKYEMDNDHGGINIEKAKEILKAEDKFDKQLFRRRVKEKHKDEKRKLKQKRKTREEDNMEARLGSSEDEEGSEPDTSWIPDPDKLVNGKSDNYSEEENEHEEDEEVVPRKKLKKAKETFDTGLSLAEDEEIALRLLLNSTS